MPATSNRTRPDLGAGEIRRTRPQGSTKGRRRRYDSPIRREQVARTRQAILSAGSAIAHELPSWNWRELTFRAVAERAGVSERTVYRHFPSERELHDAVMGQLEREAGVCYENITIDQVSAVATRVFAARGAFAVAPSAVNDPAFAAEDQRRKDALLGAVEAVTPEWTPEERELAAAILDVLWSMPAYERLVTAWRLDARQAIRAIDWAIRSVVAGIEGDRRPEPAQGHDPIGEGTDGA